MSKQKKNKEQKKIKEKPKEPDKEEGNDFGGIPDRDLKKNLGCG